MKDIMYINGRFLTQKVTGVQRYAIEVVKQIDKLEPNKEIKLLCPKGASKNLNLKNIKIVEIGKLNGQFWEQISLPLYILKRGRGKLLSLGNLAPIIYPGYVTIHDIGFKTHGEHLSKKFSTWYKIVTKLNIKRYKHIFTVSNFSKNEIIENYKVDSNKITVTYNSAEHLKNIVPDDSILRKLGLENKEFYFSLGSKSPHKNHKYIEDLAKNNSNKIFVVTGNNNKIFKDNSEEDINNMLYTGYLKDEEIAALYKNCKAFIFPSLYEGFGIPPLEAMVMGCKNIVVSDIPVFREVYGNSVSYIDVNRIIDLDAIQISNKEEISNILEKYKWNEVANKIINKLTM